MTIIVLNVAIANQLIFDTFIIINLHVLCDYELGSILNASVTTLAYCKVKLFTYFIFILCE